MDNATLFLGSIPIFVGVFSGAQRAKGARPTSMKNLQKQWGDRDGSTIHFMGYCILPIVVGASIIFVEFNGGFGKFWQHFWS